MILIITPVYKAYDKVKEMCDAIDQFTVNPFLHILVDDDSNLTEPFPVEVTSNRRVILLKRDAIGSIHKNGGGQAIQIGYEWAHHAFINEHPNPLPYDHIFMIESDCIVKEDWDQKMIEIIPTLPEDWLTLDCQSVDAEGNLTYPTTVSVRLGFDREDLEIMQYPDFQSTLFNPKIFEAGIKFSDFPSHFDITFGKRTAELIGGKHYRTTCVEVLHYFYQSRQHLNEIPKT